MELQTRIHGTCLSVGGSGVLLIGPPGSGKSDLALRLIDAPGYGISSVLMRAEMVSDDQVIITRQGEILRATAPASIQGKMEIRGLNVVSLPNAVSAPLSLVVKLHPHVKIERLPEAATFEILGMKLPLIELDGLSASAPARLRAALGWIKRTLETVAQPTG